MELEEPFKQEQGSLKSLEKAESKLYEEMIRLNMDDFDRIAALSDKALKTAGNREKHLNSEKESIDEAKQEFEANKASAEKIEDQKVRKKLRTLLLLWKSATKPTTRFMTPIRTQSALTKSCTSCSKTKVLNWMTLRHS